MTHQFKQGQLILVRLETRDNMHYLWNAQQYMAERGEHMFVLGGYFLKDEYEFLPFEGNEHLLGTRNDPAPKWEPKEGELVAVSDDKKKWFAQVFISKIRGREEGAYESSDTHDSSQPSYWQYCEPLHKHFKVSEVE